MGQTPRLCNLPIKSYSKIKVPYTIGDDLIKESTWIPRLCNLTIKSYSKFKVPFTIGDDLTKESTLLSWCMLIPTHYSTCTTIHSQTVSYRTKIPETPIHFSGVTNFFGPKNEGAYLRDIYVCVLASELW